jgi:hypothetical protein
MPDIDRLPSLMERSWNAPGTLAAAKARRMPVMRTAGVVAACSGV